MFLPPRSASLAWGLQISLKLRACRPVVRLTPTTPLLIGDCPLNSYLAPGEITLAHPALKVSGLIESKPAKGG